jgi:hypothetical protein
MPRNLRTYFRRDRRLLAVLPRLAWDTVREVYAAVLGRTDRLPGMVAVPQTFGELAHWNPHVHALVTDGAFAPDGTFVPLPETAAADFAGVWREKVFALLRDAGCINGRVGLDRRPAAPTTLGRAHSPCLRGRSSPLSPLWRPDEDHRLPRTARPGRHHCPHPAPLRSLDRPAAAHPKVPPARAEAVEPELLYVAEEGGVYPVPGT